MGTVDTNKSVYKTENTELNKWSSYLKTGYTTFWRVAFIGYHNTTTILKWKNSEEKHILAGRYYKELTELKFIASGKFCIASNHMQ